MLNIKKIKYKFLSFINFVFVCILLIPIFGCTFSREVVFNSYSKHEYELFYSGLFAYEKGNYVQAENFLTSFLEETKYKIIRVKIANHGGEHVNTPIKYDYGRFKSLIDTHRDGVDGTFFGTKLYWGFYRVGYACYLIGEIYYKRGNIVKAIVFYNKANNYAQKGGKALIKIKHAIIKKNKNELDQALQILTSAYAELNDLNFYEEVSNALRLIAQIYEQKGDFRKAIMYYKRVEGHDNKHSLPYSSLNNINLAMIHLSIGYYDDAMIYCNKISEKENKLIERGNTDIVSDTYIVKSMILKKQGDYQNALISLDNALSLYSKSYDNPNNQKILIEKGEIYSYLNQYNEAKQSYNEAKIIATKLEDERAIIQCLLGLGKVYNQSGQYGKAINCFNEVVSISEKKGNNLLLQMAYSNLGISYSKTNNLNSSLQYFNKALSIAKKVGSKSVGMNMINVANTLIYSGNLDKAEVIFLEAIKILEDLNNKEFLWVCYRDYANLLLKKEDTEQAISYLKKSINTIEGMRTKLKIDVFKSGFTENKLSVYEKIIDIMMSNGMIDESLLYAEKAKSRILADLIAETKISSNNNKSLELITEAKKLESHINVLNERIISKINESNSKNKNIIENLQTDLDYNVRSLRGLKQKVYKLEPKRLSLVSASILRPKEIKNILKTGTVILEFFSSKDKTYIWSINKDDINGETIQFGYNDIGIKVQEIRQLLSHQKDIKNISEKLYNILIKSSLEKLNNVNIQRLCIIPHGPLHYLPFQALYDGEKYLIEKYEIFYNMSSTVLSFCKDQKQEKGNSVLAFGNPYLGSDDYNLPFSENEVSILGNIFPTTQILIGNNATEESFRDNYNNFSILHFACHSVFDANFPMNSAIKLAKSKVYDGDITAEEIFNLNMKPYLVVLSACETGLGKIESGDEIIGFNRAFMYAGSPSIIATLWQINDESTSCLMKEFYRNIKNMDKASALRLAQLLTMERYKHPFYWAAFGLYGYYE